MILVTTLVAAFVVSLTVTKANAHLLPCGGA